MITQRDSFAELFKKLEDGSGKRVKHGLDKLSQYINSYNVIQLKGRLSKATIGENLKHPILRSTKHPAVILMLRQMHEDNHHEGTEYVRSLVQQRFLGLGLRNVLHSIKSNFGKCKKPAV